MDKPPIYEEPDSTILARIALQLVRLRWLHLGKPDLDPPTLIYSTSRNLDIYGYTNLRFALHSLAAHVASGMSSQDWFRGVAYRAAYGGVTRWHFFAQYKSNRKLYPRVTNRGVQTSQPHTISGHENESDDA